MFRIIAKEISQAFRRLQRAPAFTIVAVFTLALGIGATTAIFSVVDTVLFRALPYEAPDRLVRVFGELPERGQDRESASVPDYFDWRDQSQSLENISAFVRWSFNLSNDDSPQRVWGAMATHDLFATMGVSPALGRAFDASEDRPGGDKVAVIGHGLWQSLFGGAEEIGDRKIRLDGVEHAIVGVMPADFAFPSDARVWVPLGFDRDSFPRGVHALRVVGRRADGYNLAAAEEEMDAIAGRLARQYPDSNAGRGIVLVPLQQHWIGDVRLPLLVLLAGSALVLLIACVNVANLMVVRVLERLGEMSLRSAMGATRSRLVLQLVSEGLVLSVVGGIVGTLVGVIGVKGLVALQLAQQNTSFLADRIHAIPRLAEVSLDGRVLLFSLLLTGATALLVTLVPALRLPEKELNRWLRESGSRTVGSGGRSRLRNLLVVGEIAMAVCLAICAGLMARSYASLTQVNPGFDAANVATFQISLPVRQYPTATSTATFFSEMLRRVETLPGVESAGLTWGLPLSDVHGTVDFVIPDQPPRRPGEENVAALQPVSPAYFETLGIPLRAGRLLGDRDDAESPAVVLVNETLAKIYWPQGEAVGKQLAFRGIFGPVGQVPNAVREVVGVVADTKNLGLAEAPQPEIYFPYRQGTWRMMTLAVKTSVAPLTLTRDIHRELAAIDPHLAVAHIQTLEGLIDQATSQAKLHALLLSLFAFTALTLAAVGVYGVLSYLVRQRRAEFGLRIALGASRREVINQTLKHGLAMTAAGLFLGLIAAFAVGRLLSGLLFEISATDITTFAVVFLSTLAAAFLACYLPARRAAAADPMVVLRLQ